MMNTRTTPSSDRSNTRNKGKRELDTAERGTGTGRLGKIVDGVELWGPDLRKLPTLEQYLARLDAVRHDPCAYAEEWLAVSGEMSGGSGATLFWGREDGDDAEPQLYGAWVALDGLQEERRRRADALIAHRPKDSRYRQAICDRLLATGQFSDNRPAPRRVVFAVVRTFLENRGRLMISPEGKIEFGGCWPANLYDDRSGEQLDTAEEAIRAIVRLERRWRAREVIERIVRTLGEPVSGWIVLKAAR